MNEWTEHTVVRGEKLNRKYYTWKGSVIPMAQNRDPGTPTPHPASWRSSKNRWDAKPTSSAATFRGRTHSDGKGCPAIQRNSWKSWRTFRSYWTRRMTRPSMKLLGMYFAGMSQLEVGQFPKIRFQEFRSFLWLGIRIPKIGIQGYAMLLTIAVI